MKNLVEFFVLVCVLWLLGFLFKGKQVTNCEFMDIQHTNICRAVAAIIIIFQHISGGFGIKYLTPLGGIGVAMFLILSGYGLNESYKKKKSGGGYWKSKIIRVLVPYVIVSIVVIAVQFLVGVEIAIPYYWYLDFVFFQYIVFYLIITHPEIYERRYLVLGAVSAATFIFCGFIGNGLRAEQAVSFFIGVWISDNYLKIKKWLTNPKVLTALAVVGIILLAVKQIPTIRMQEGGFLWQGIQLIMKVSVAVAFIGLTYRYRTFFNNGFIVLGSQISYELYLVHFRLLALPQKGIGGMCAFLALSLIGAWGINNLTNIVKRKIK